MKVFVEGLFFLDKDVAGFKEHLRDFLVQIKALPLTLITSIVIITIPSFSPSLRSIRVMMYRTCFSRRESTSCFKRRMRNDSKNSLCPVSSTHTTGQTRCKNETHPTSPARSNLLLLCCFCVSVTKVTCYITWSSSVIHSSCVDLAPNVIFPPSSAYLPTHQ